LQAEYPAIPKTKTPDADTAFHREMHSPVRLVLPGSEKKRNAAIEADPKLKAAIAGKQFVPVKAENVGIEAGRRLHLANYADDTGALLYQHDAAPVLPRTP
jgi:hypothetical protein